MFSFIVAMDENKGIGLDNHLPWNLKEELAHFKRITLNKTLIMGSNTFKSLPKKLSQRKILVVSRNNGDINNLKAFLIEHQDDLEEYLIAGGRQIYEISYPYCKKAYVSIIKGKYPVDCYFDSFEINDFELIQEEKYTSFNYFELKRKNM